mmetsp:Transcript_64786/g.173850  ORF Transcript_64786/g.173850 Transcript_64786/m.173850 type:complete len:101 (+) Transcript_64786:573-875(+)
MTRQVITWTPARGTESRTWKVCVKVHDPTFTAWFILRCSSLTVAKCAMCGNAGDTLGSIAQVPASRFSCCGVSSQNVLRFGCTVSILRLSSGYQTRINID